MRRAVDGEEDALLVPLQARRRELADAGRDREAAVVAEHIAALGVAVRRQARLDALRGIDRITLDLPDGSCAELRRGRLAQAWPGPTGRDVASSDRRRGSGRAVGSGRSDAGEGPTHNGNRRHQSATDSGPSTNGNRAGDHPGSRNGRGLTPGGGAGRGGRRRADGGGDLARAAEADPESLVLPPRPEDGPVPVEMVDELACVARWLARCAPHVLAGIMGGDAGPDAQTPAEGAREGDRGVSSPGLRCLAC